VMLQDGLLCRCLPGPLDIGCHSILEFLFIFLSGWPIYWWQRSIKVSLYQCVWGLSVF
jgi:hypothetical protein